MRHQAKRHCINRYIFFCKIKYEVENFCSAIYFAMIIWEMTHIMLTPSDLQSYTHKKIISKDSFGSISLWCREMQPKTTYRTILWSIIFWNQFNKMLGYSPVKDIWIFNFAHTNNRSGLCCVSKYPYGWILFHFIRIFEMKTEQRSVKLLIYSSGAILYLPSEDGLVRLAPPSLMSVRMNKKIPVERNQPLVNKYECSTASQPHIRDDSELIWNHLNWTRQIEPGRFRQPIRPSGGLLGQDALKKVSIHGCLCEIWIHARAA